MEPNSKSIEHEDGCEWEGMPDPCDCILEAEECSSSFDPDCDFQTDSDGNLL